MIGDAELLGRLVENLVTNAVKFTPAGGHVCVSARAAESRWTIEVRDDGIGIPADELETLFLRFRRASNARDLQIPGTGLGLTIAKVVADLHSASIEVESTPGVGTTVHLQFPVQDDNPLHESH